MDRTEVIFDKRIEKGKLGLKRLKEASEAGYEVNEKLLFKLLAETKIPNMEKNTILRK